MKILVVDDSKAMRMIVRRTLRMAGFHADITEASSAAEALEAVRTGGINLILCDWNMPEMNGIELLTRLRSDGQQVRLGFVTSESSADARDTAKQAGALFLIAKPFTPEGFRDTLAPFLGA
jgi:two-component system chemotaxis response regulator CheY